MRREVGRGGPDPDSLGQLGTVTVGTLANAANRVDIGNSGSLPLPD